MLFVSAVFCGFTPENTWSPLTRRRRPSPTAGPEILREPQRARWPARAGRGLGEANGGGCGNQCCRSILPGDDTGVVKDTCGDGSSYLTCPQLQSDSFGLPNKCISYVQAPSHMNEAQKDCTNAPTHVAKQALSAVAVDCFWVMEHAFIFKRKRFADVAYLLGVASI